jgi:hypothetical protein
MQFELEVWPEPWSIRCLGLIKSEVSVTLADAQRLTSAARLMAAQLWLDGIRIEMPLDRARPFLRSGWSFSHYVMIRECGIVKHGYSDFVISPPQPSDFDDLVSLVATSIREGVPRQERNSRLEEDVREDASVWLQRISSTGPTRIAVAYIGERFAGYGIWMRHDQFVHLYDLTILPRFRGCGASEAILNYIARSVDEFGCRWIQATLGHPISSVRRETFRKLRKDGWWPLRVQLALDAD